MERLTDDFMRVAGDIQTARRGLEHATAEMNRAVADLRNVGSRIAAETASARGADRTGGGAGGERERRTPAVPAHVRGPA